MRHLCEPLGGTEGLVETVGFKKMTECRLCDEEQARMPIGSEFQTGGLGAATLKLRETNFVWTRGTNIRLVLEEGRERVGMW